MSLYLLDFTLTDLTRVFRHLLSVRSLNAARKSSRGVPSRPRAMDWAGRSVQVRLWPVLGARAHCHWSEATPVCEEAEQSSLWPPSLGILSTERWSSPGSAVVIRPAVFCVSWNVEALMLKFVNVYEGMRGLAKSRGFVTVWFCWIYLSTFARTWRTWLQDEEWIDNDLHDLASQSWMNSQYPEYTCSASDIVFIESWSSKQHVCGWAGSGVSWSCRSLAAIYSLPAMASGHSMQWQCVIVTIFTSLVLVCDTDEV